MWLSQKPQSEEQLAIATSSTASSTWPTLYAHISFCDSHGKHCTTHGALAYVYQHCVQHGASHGNHCIIHHCGHLHARKHQRPIIAHHARMHACTRACMHACMRACMRAQALLMYRTP